MYNRMAAVRYAEQWWNKRNPAFRSAPPLIGAPPASKHCETKLVQSTENDGKAGFRLFHHCSA